MSMDEETFEEIALMQRFIDRMIVNRRDIERNLFVPKRKELLQEFDKQIAVIGRIVKKLEKT